MVANRVQERKLRWRASCVMSRRLQREKKGRRCWVFPSPTHIMTFFAAMFCEQARCRSVKTFRGFVRPANPRIHRLRHIFSPIYTFYV